MVNIIKAKLEQHPRLVSEITKQGGSAWILSSTHQPTKQNSVWETGGQNWFIESLNDAYLSTQSSTSVKPTEQTSEVKVVNEVYDKIDDGIYSLNLNYKGKDYTMVIDRDGEITDASYYNPNTLKDVDVKSSFFKFTSEDIKNIFSEIEQPAQPTSGVEPGVSELFESNPELANASI
jgi:hypothetical protein